MNYRQFAGILASFVVIETIGCGQGAAQRPSSSTVESSEVQLQDGSALSPTTPNASEHPALPVQPTSGTAGRQAFARLMTAVKENDPHGWKVAEQALAELGTAALPAFIAGADDADPLTREFATMFLAQLGPQAEPALETLLRLLGDNHPMIVANAAAALSTFESPPPRAIEALQQLLDSSGDEATLITAVNALANLGGAAEPTVPQMELLLRNPSAMVRQSAAATLGRLGSVAVRSLPALQRLVEDDDEAVRNAAVVALQQLEQASLEGNGIAIPAGAKTTDRP